MIRWHLSKKPEGSDRLSHVKPGGEGQSSRKVEVGVCLLWVGTSEWLVSCLGRRW